MVTMMDVAKRAGVSIATVSRVINSPEVVSPATREKVQKAIDELGFVVSYFAHVLVTKKTGLIGVIVPDIAYEYYAIMLSGIEDYANKKGFKIIICNIEEKLDKEIEYLSFFAEMRVDGIVLMHERLDDEVRSFLLNLNIPVVMASIYPRLLADRFSSVNIDDFHAAFDATNYLIKKGRSKIAFIAGSLADATSGEARFNGYKEGLRSNSIRFDKSLVRFGDFSIEAGEALALDIFSDTTNKPDAIFAAGDVIAIGALNAMKKLSIKVPEQVALVGFDDLTCATVCSPRLTTVRQPIRTIGSEAVKVLVSEITNHPSVPTRKILPYELIEREST